jgi:hypothetical protein
VSDLTKYLFEREDEPTFTVKEGRVFGEDDLLISYYKKDGFIYCVRANPNYILSVTAGEVLHYSYPSLVGILMLSLVFLFFLFVVALGVSLIIRAKRNFRGRGEKEDGKRNNGNKKRGGKERPTEEITFKLSEKETRLSEPKYDVSQSKPQSETAKREEVNPQKEKTEEETPSEEKEASLSETATPIDSERADNLISDSLAKSLLRRTQRTVWTEGNKKGIINVDTLSDNFSAGDSVDVNLLKEKNLIPYDTAYIKVLARGIIDKPLYVYANDFSLSAVKMIALSGGKAVKVNSVIKNK